MTFPYLVLKQLNLKVIMGKLEAEGKIFYRIGVAGRLIFWKQ
ncbi:hypothetical protein [Elizabethkingia ursingii]